MEAKTARLANCSYELTNSIDEFNNCIGPNQFEIFSHNTKYAELIDHANNEVHLVIRGTDVFNLKSAIPDLVNDAAILLGLNPPRLEEMKNIIAQTPPGYEVYISGHSLGGRIAIELGKIYSHDVTVYAFNPGYSPITTSISDLFNYRPTQFLNINEFHIDNDLISYRGNQSVGHFNHFNLNKNILSAHSMSNFKDYFDQLEYSRINVLDSENMTIFSFDKTFEEIVHDKYYIFDDGDKTIFLDKNNLETLYTNLKTTDKLHDIEKISKIIDDDMKITLDDIINKIDTTNKILNIMGNWQNMSKLERIVSCFKLVPRIENNLKFSKILNLALNWKHMTKKQRLLTLGSYVVNNHVYDIVKNALSLGKNTGNTIITSFIENFTHTPTGTIMDTIIDISRNGFKSAIRRTIKETAINTIIMAVPQLKIVYYIYTLGKTLKKLLTKHHTYTIGNIAAFETDIKTTHGLKFGHHVIIENKFFNIKASVFRRHHRSAQAAASDEFVRQANMNVYLKIGIPFSCISNTLDANPNSYTLYKRMKFISNTKNKWLDINDKYMNDQDRMKLIEFYNGNTGMSFLNLHGNEDIFTFGKNLYLQCKNVKSCKEGIQEIFKFFFNVKLDDERSAVDTFNKLENSRTRSDNNTLNEYRLRQQNEYNLSINSFSRWEIIKYAHISQLKQDFSINSIISSIGLCINTLCYDFILNFKKEKELMKNKDYCKFKAKQLAIITGQSFAIKVITNHSIIALGLCKFMDKVSQKFLNEKVAPIFGLVTGVIFNKIISKINDVKESELNVISNISNVLQTITKMCHAKISLLIAKSTNPAILALNKVCIKIGLVISKTLTTIAHSLGIVGSVTVSVPLVGVIISAICLAIFLIAKLIEHIVKHIENKKKDPFYSYWEKNPFRSYWEKNRFKSYWEKNSFKSYWEKNSFKSYYEKKSFKSYYEKKPFKSFWEKDPVTKNKPVKNKLNTTIGRTTIGRSTTGRTAIGRTAIGRSTIGKKKN